MADDADDAQPSPRRFGPWRRETGTFLELFALSGIAVAQPTLDSLRKNSYDFFVAAGAGRGLVLALVAIILFVPPAVLWAIEAAIGAVAPIARKPIHSAFAGLIVGVIAAEVLAHQTDLGGAARIVIALIIAAGAALLIARVTAATLFLRYLAFAPIVFAVLFVTSEQVSPLVLSSVPAAGVDVKIEHPNRVVMIVMDELPLESLLDGTGHVDAGLFPNFAKLAAGSTWYRNTTTVAPYTSAAVPALLTGNYPENPRATPTSSVYPHSLFTLLGGTYRVNAHENLEQLNPGGDAEPAEGLGWTVGKAVGRWKDFAWPPTIAPGAGFRLKINRVTLQEELPSGRHFIRSLGSSPDKQFDYLHVLVPHIPWHLLPDGRSYTDLANPPGAGLVWTDPVLAGVARQRHILQLQASDTLLGQIIGKLQRHGVYEKSLIVVTADHGEGFVAKSPLRKATPSNYPGVMWVPLLIKAPGQTVGKVDDRPARSIDVLPTVAEILGAKLPWKIDGRSLFKEPRADGPRRLLEIPLAMGVELPATARYQRWDGPSGFARVLKSEAAAPGTDEALRVYKGTSAFGDLVGKPVAPFVDPNQAAIKGGFTDPSVFQAVNTEARMLPWTYTAGHLDADAGTEVAITINGTIASLTPTVADPFAQGSTFFAVLPPTLFRDGRNDVRAYAVRGSSVAPSLTLVSLEN